MTRPILLQVDRSAEANESCAHFADVFGVQPAGVELVLSSDAWKAIVEGDDESGTHGVSDSRYGIRAIAALCTAIDIERAIEGTTRLLKIASASGATLLNLSMSPLTHSPDAPGFRRYQDVLNFAYQLFRAIRLESESKGVTVALEAACGGCFLSPVELREWIDSVNSWAIGVCINIARVAAIGSPFDWIATLTHRVKAVRWSVDSPADCKPRGISMKAHDKVALAGALKAIDAEAPIILSRDSGDVDSLRGLVSGAR